MEIEPNDALYKKASEMIDRTGTHRGARRRNCKAVELFEQVVQRGRSPDHILAMHFLAELSYNGDDVPFGCAGIGKDRVRTFVFYIRVLEELVLPGMSAQHVKLFGVLVLKILPNFVGLIGEIDDVPDVVSSLGRLCALGNSMKAASRKHGEYKLARVMIDNVQAHIYHAENLRNDAHRLWERVVKRSTPELLALDDTAVLAKEVAHADFKLKEMRITERTMVPLGDIARENEDFGAEKMQLYRDNERVMAAKDAAIDASLDASGCSNIFSREPPTERQAANKVIVAEASGSGQQITFAKSTHGLVDVKCVPATATTLTCCGCAARSLQQQQCRCKKCGALLHFCCPECMEIHWKKVKRQCPDHGIPSEVD